MAAAFIAFVGSIAHVGIRREWGSGGGHGRRVAHGATPWATVVYAFGPQYFRLHSAGEDFEFDFDDSPRFTDFLSPALVISSAGSYTAAAPTIRAAMRAVRSHTVIAFVFNALVIAMTVSLITDLVMSLSAG